MPVIKQLDSRTIAKIAAGEVVERPLSVVKELMENALDAGAMDIAVDLEEGGAGLIRVSDNGRGMEPADVKLCVQSHTTSKLTLIDDLESLVTLGFRGEALHSIAAVSRMTVTACAAGGNAGHSVRIEGGILKASDAAGRPHGTTIEVRNLFFNVPARLKFMKSARSEIQAVTELVSRFAVARPEVAFRLTHNGRESFTAPVAATRLERLRHILGKDIAARIQQTGGVYNNMELTAYFGLPDIAFSNRRYQIFFVNGHLVKDRTMTLAVDIAYKGLLAKDHFALALLFLDMPASEVDVNVHPAKTEVRFLKTHDVHSLIFRTLRARFEAGFSSPKGDTPFSFNNAADGAPDNVANTQQPPGANKTYYTSPATPEPHVPIFASLKKKSPPPGNVDIKSDDTSGRSENEPSSYKSPPPDIELSPQSRPVQDSLDLEIEQDAARVFASDKDDDTQAALVQTAISFEILGQFYNTFILVKLNGQPVFIDQHTAAERVIYNRLKRARRARPAQLTLLGEPVEVPHDVHAVLLDNLELIKEAGLEVEPFGARAFVVRSVAHNAPDFDPADMLVSLAHDIATAPYTAARDDILDRLLITSACKLAVKAGMSLTNEEMRALIKDYLTEEFVRTCPHGRPIIHEVSLEQLKAWFHR